MNQGALETALSTIFPVARVFKNVRKKVSITNPLTQGYLEVDVWYPDMKLCFEYQDSYHYEPTEYSHVPLAITQEKDYIKKNMLLQRGETLILVPFWWDGSSISLYSTIQFYRPDLLSSLSRNNFIIPVNPPFHFLTANQLMLASFPVIETSVDDSNTWWLGEKYDGIRCFWDSDESQLYSRRNLSINLLPSINQSLDGRIEFDGEVWCGRGQFAESQTAISANLNNWDSLRVICFDDISSQIRESPFEGRYSYLLSHFPPFHSTVIIALRLLCSCMTSLMYCLHQVLEVGGEGIIAQKSFSTYIPGRSTSLLKVKGSQLDQEALVADVETDGSLVLQLPTGISFVVPTESCILPRRALPGDVVTFTQEFQHDNIIHDNIIHDNITLDLSTYQTNNNNKPTITKLIEKIPLNPVVYRIRTDLSWEDIVGSGNHHHVRYLPFESNEKRKDSVAMPKGYPGGAKQMRAIMESFAQQSGFNPLVPSNWYSVGTSFVKDHKEVRTIVQHFDDSFVQAVINLFPELQLDTTKFTFFPRNYWGDVKNRRAAIENIAHSKGEDPLLPSFWYNINYIELLASKKLSALSHYYKNTAEIASHLFPEVKIDSKQLKYLNLKTQQKEIFLLFAKIQSFDPLIPSNWHNRNLQDLLSFPLAHQLVTNFYRSDYYKALGNIFPEMFRLVPSKIKKNISNMQQRDILLQFARSLSFDPLIPSNWYCLDSEDFRSFTAIDKLIKRQYYHQSKNYRKAAIALVMDTFPSIGLVPHEFKSKRRMNYWKDTSKRKQFFTSFASERGFDPLVSTNWYPISYTSLLMCKGFSMVKEYYASSIPKALIDLFPNIGLESSKFKPEKEWKHKEAQKWFLGKVAQKFRFNPMRADKWTELMNSNLVHKRLFKTVAHILGKYETPSQALSLLFPPSVL